MTTYSPASQIVERQIEYFNDKKVLIAGEIGDDFALELDKHCHSVTLFTTNYKQYKEISSSSTIHCYFGAQLEEALDIDVILLYWPKAKAEADYLLQMLLSKLKLGVEVCIVGENRSGVKSAEKIFAPYGPLTKYDSARRCSFYWGLSEQKPEPFNLDQWFKEYQITIAGETLTICTLPGVFSHGSLDLGTELLLDTVPKLSGKVLDFGCGAGVIGSALKRQNPGIELEMVDISALAIQSAKKTLQENGLEGKVYPSDVYSDTDKNYRFIISNPPFHAGLKTFYRATETLIQSAPQKLTRSGEMIIVANNFLQYPPIFESAFGHCNEQAKTNKFRILASKNAR
ncbi:16S rRNA (guanine(1207)-N(2))-methyltransferase RsmC [Vibrio sp. SS-MA-C1-2]|uniref:16S rRNA (guanine(1207)-N(2))-methyltransferase RsmC n=1 Tax=Vibrio sp. SS-MA-C1-2 TaxID=2908646 RepID=UPI001F301E9B|nr:16S rRNA (guanine(1207)-N(2))-methyltransferase RsmC [Vibrio sp. SS-MA-C1-2]UJF19076.1 16S rRNA (guanine(1207)-N(2))-methyltransferase RsmC [Vibrio sp. SS-MA-C1-2]